MIEHGVRKKAIAASVVIRPHRVSSHLRTFNKRMTSRNLLSESNILDEIGEMSFYEDALDLSEDELQKLCTDTVRHLRQARRNQLSRLEFEGQPERSQSAVMASSPKPSHANIQSSSSGDNSSIERISCGRRSNVSESQNPNGGGQAQSSRSRQSMKRRAAQHSNSSTNGDWKVVNSFDYSYFPTLFQIDKQIQLVLRELREIQLGNSLQLQLIYRLTKLFIASKKRKWGGVNGVPLSLWFLMLLWPLLIQLCYYFYKKNQYSFLTFMDII